MTIINTGRSLKFVASNPKLKISWNGGKKEKRKWARISNIESMWYVFPCMV